jgi:hypothetical protein
MCLSLKLIGYYGSKLTCQAGKCICDLCAIVNDLGVKTVPLLSVDRSASLPKFFLSYFFLLTNRHVQLDIGTYRDGDHKNRYM